MVHDTYDIRDTDNIVGHTFGAYSCGYYIYIYIYIYICIYVILLLHMVCVIHPIHDPCDTYDTYLNLEDLTQT